VREYVTLDRCGIGKSKCRDCGGEFVGEIQLTKESNRFEGWRCRRGKFGFVLLLRPLFALTFPRISILLARILACFLFRLLA